MPVPRLVRHIAVEVAFWYLLPCAFLAIYVGVLRQPASSIVPHLWAVSILFALLCMLRLFVARVVTNAAIRLAISSLVLASFMGTMLTYYVLAFISVRFWGSIVALPAIPTFFRQAPDVAEAVGLEPFVAGAAAVVAVAAVFVICWLTLRRWDWTRDLGRSGWIKAICAAAAACVVWLQVSNVTEAPWIDAAEPMSMTLFPMAGTRNIEGHLVTDERAKALDVLEDRARASYVPNDASPRPNVILFVVDALRPANMSLFGYDRKTTPWLDEIAARQPVRKFVAHAPCSDTGCGLLSLTGSKLPGDFSFRPFSLHEALHRHGYRIHVLQSGDHTYFHPMRGYYGEIDTWLDGNTVRTSSINDDSILVDKLATMPDSDGTPAMFHFHLMSAHVTRKDDGKRAFAPANSYLLPPGSDGKGGDIVVPAATNYYDNGILASDHIIRTLMQQLQRKGYLDRALIVVTGDHGEALGEHGMFAHANSVYEEVLKIPVVFVANGYEPGSFASDTAFPLQMDIAPTMLTEIGMPLPATWKGKPLQAPYEPLVAYFEQRDSAGVFDTRQPGKHWKYWMDLSSGDEFVFDLAADPREADNLASTVSGELLHDWRRQVVYSRPKR